MILWYKSNSSNGGASVKNLLEKIPAALSKERHSAEKAPARAEKKNRPRGTNKRFALGALAISAVLLCMCVYWTLDAFSVASKSAMDAFSTAKAATEQKVYDKFYDYSRKKAEEAHHVSNNISISIGDLSSVQNLEVLRVSDVDYQITKPEDKNWLDSILSGFSDFFEEEMVSWLEVPGSGVFTVNLKIGEFIVDEIHQYVLIRVPNPKLTQFSVDYENVEVLLFDKGGVLKDTAKCGVDKAKEQLQNAEVTLVDKITSNQDSYERARASTEKMLISLVKQLNPQLPELTVEVEFID